jgi:hypothetical protein
MFSMTSVGGGWVCRWRRFVLLTVLIIVVPTALAAQNPSLAARAYALTGATGVCIVCYIIPIFAHFKLLLWPEASADGDQSAGQSLLVDVDEQDANQAVPVRHKEVYSEKPSTIGGWLVAVLLPVAVLVIGCTLSGIALVSSS